METNLFEQAKQMVQQLLNDDRPNDASERDKIAAKAAIRSAYTEASAEERALLNEFEQQLERKNKLH